MPIRKARAIVPLLFVCGVTACSSGTPPEPAIVPTPAVHAFARLQKTGELDPGRLSCAADAVLPRIEGETRSDRRGWRNTPPLTVGQPLRSPITEELAANAAKAVPLSEVHRGSSGGTAAALGDALRWRRSAGVRYNNSRRDWRPGTGARRSERLLREYAALFSGYLRQDGPSDPQPRLAEIGRDSPEVMEAYARLLLISYEDPRLTCPGS